MHHLSKSLFNCFVFLLFIFIINACSSEKENAEIDNKYTEVTEGNYTYKFVKGDPLQTRIYTLSNGLTVYLSPNKRKPEIDVQVAIKAGSKNDPATATGLAHYLEHMLFKGTSQLGTRNWAAEKPLLDSISNLYEQYRATTDLAKRKALYAQIDAISFKAANYAIPNEYDKAISGFGGTGTNAYTWFDQTVYVNTIPSNAVERWATIEAERFSQLVPRLFHTELEAVYEEKNISLDNDNEKVFDEMFASLFPTHPYGTQTTIGTIEHLKNPSIKEIQKFFDTWYVPNNMAVVMAGDLDPAKTIEIIDNQFKRLKKKELPAQEKKSLARISRNVEKTIVGPNPAYVSIAFAVNGANSTDKYLVKVLNEMLSNEGQVGLIDKNLAMKQIVRNPGSSIFSMAEAGLFFMQASPKENQSLVEVQKHLLAQVDSLKAGKFPDWLVEAAVKNIRVRDEKATQYNGTRVSALVDAYLFDVDYLDLTKEGTELEKITKADFVKWANDNLKNYVAIKKEQGTPPAIAKVEKPAITPVSLNRDDESGFMKMINKIELKDLEPTFPNLAEVKKKELKPMVNMYYQTNTTDKLGSVKLVYKTGTATDKHLDLATDYINLIGSNSKSAEKLKEEFYKLGLTYQLYTSNLETVALVSGLDENLEKGLALLNEIISTPKADENVLANIISDELQERQDNKADKDYIAQVGLVSYLMYGAKNPTNFVLTNAEVKACKSDILLGKIKALPSIEQRIEYYGNRSQADVEKMLEANYLKNVGSVKAGINEMPFKMQANMKPTIYFCNYDMVQANIFFYAPGKERNDANLAKQALYNEYFGGNMGSIVFQEIRESKALAYSCYARANMNSNPKDIAYLSGFVGTQADKFNQAVDAMKEIIVKMPESPTAFGTAASSLKKQIASERYVDSYIPIVVSLEKFGRKEMPQQTVWQGIQNLSLQDIKQYQESNIKNTPISLAVIGSEKKLNKKQLEKYGELKVLSIEALLGY